MNDTQAREGKRRDGYIVAVLSRGAVTRLQRLAAHEVLYCRHMTIAFRPNPKSWKRFKRLVGNDRVLTVVGMVQDKHAQAVLVTGCHSRNEHPHVTISCAEGVEPSYTNDMIARAVADGTVEPVPTSMRNPRLEVHVQFKQFTEARTGGSVRPGWKKVQAKKARGKKKRGGKKHGKKPAR